MEGAFFKEFGPIFAGCLLLLFFDAFLQRGWSRRTKFLVTLAASALIGVLATPLSGEFRASWAFVLLDMTEVFVASQVVVFFIYRPLRCRRARHAGVDANGERACLRPRGIQGEPAAPRTYHTPVARAYRSD